MLLYLKIKPNQRFERIEFVDGEWIVRVKSPAIDGKANENLINYLSEVLNLPKSKICIKKGTVSRTKCLEIEAEAEYINKCLEAASGSLHNKM